MSEAYPLPAALDALVRAMAERHRLGLTSAASLAVMAAELEHAAQWACELAGGRDAIATDLAVTSQRLATLAGTDDQEHAA